ncbi:MAG TPA: DMT family transporter [Terriglobales bacterium]|nr:DMT family transporter [Terriglobales bacterium]
MPVTVEQAEVEQRLDDPGTTSLDERELLSLSVSRSSVRSLELPSASLEMDTSHLAGLRRKSVSSVGLTFRTKWFWYSIISLLCWTAWALTAKIGSSELPPSEMQFVSGLGFLLVSIAVTAFAKKGSSPSRKGRLYSVVSGVLLGIGGLASFGAYRIGVNTAATTGITSLYPAITVIFALLVLKERLTKSQMAGLFFSGLAILLFSV